MPDPSPTLRPGDRVTHSNVCRAYGPGQVVEIVPSSIRPPSKAYVHFDGELCARLVWLGDLTPVCTSAPVPRIIWSAQSADLPLSVA